jgi:hypothetical protein
VILLSVLAFGSVATLISRLYERVLTRGYIGAVSTGYGLPLSWYVKVVREVVPFPGESTSYYFSLESFMLDIAFWSLVIGIPAVFLLKRFKPTLNRSSHLHL